MRSDCAEVLVRMVLVLVLVKQTDICKVVLVQQLSGGIYFRSGPGHFQEQLMGSPLNPVQQT